MRREVALRVVVSLVCTVLLVSVAHYTTDSGGSGQGAVVSETNSVLQRGRSVESARGAIYQTFNGAEAFPSASEQVVEESRAEVKGQLSTVFPSPHNQSDSVIVGEYLDPDGVEYDTGSSVEVGVLKFPEDSDIP